MDPTPMYNKNKISITITITTSHIISGSCFFSTYSLLTRLIARAAQTVFVYHSNQTKSFDTIDAPNSLKIPRRTTHHKSPPVY